MAESFIDTIPSELVTHVMAGCRERGKEWLAGLGGTIRELERHWSIRVSAPFPDIEYNYVAPATAEDGLEVVLKIAPPWEPVEIFAEAEYLRHRHGPECVKLLDEHQPLRAILIERLRPGDHLAERFAKRPLDMLTPGIEALRNTILPVPGELGPVHTLDKWFDNFRRWESTAFPADYARKAFEIYDRLSMAEHIYLHGDYHPGNVVGVGDSDYAVIDPKGLIGPLGYDIAVFLNNFHWMQEKLPDVGSRLAVAVRRFSEAFDIPEIELREWAYAQMVIGSWWNFEDMPDLYDGSVVKADIWEV